jgi:hypothetical protein
VVLEHVWRAGGVPAEQGRKEVTPQISPVIVRLDRTIQYSRDSGV